MSGLTGFTFDKAVLTRIAVERGVAEVTEYEELEKRDIDLITADLLLTAYLSPNVWASFNQSHGSYKKGVGSQTVYNKEEILDYLRGIYGKYEDEKLELVPDNSATVFFRNDI
ncbi:MAG: hypothetical protein J6X31_09610 [Bacteroidales bacterium]|nr:hypothetical protein [Bacteroidales bacterium]